MHSRKTVLSHWEKMLLQSGVDSPRLSAQVLLAHVLGIPRLEMLLDVETPVSEALRLQVDALGMRRMQGEPVAYLVQSKEFYGFDFQVGPEVLIPRPETELILDYLLDTQARMARLSVLDIGTGSGALAVSCAKLFPNFQIAAVDISCLALRVARENARAHQVLERISLFQGDLIGAVQIDNFDIVMANLPYVPMNTRNSLNPEVLCYEPEIALFAGPDGLDCYRALALALGGNTRPGTLLLCEIDSSQGLPMIDLFSRIASSVQVVKDFSGQDRVVVVVF